MAEPESSSVEDDAIPEGKPSASAASVDRKNVADVPGETRNNEGRLEEDFKGRITSPRAEKLMNCWDHDYCR